MSPDPVWARWEGSAAQQFQRFAASQMSVSERSVRVVERFDDGAYLDDFARKNIEAVRLEVNVNEKEIVNSGWLHTQQHGIPSTKQGLYRSKPQLKQTGFRHFG